MQMAVVSRPKERYDAFYSSATNIYSFIYSPKRVHYIKAFSIEMILVSSGAQNRLRFLIIKILHLSWITNLWCTFENSFMSRCISSLKSTIKREVFGDLSRAFVYSSVIHQPVRSLAKVLKSETELFKFSRHMQCEFPWNCRGSALEGKSFFVLLILRRPIPLIPFDYRAIEVIN
jgi:hypothetical protein